MSSAPSFRRIRKQRLMDRITLTLSLGPWTTTQLSQALLAHPGRVRLCVQELRANSLCVVDHIERHGAYRPFLYYRLSPKGERTAKEILCQS